MSQHTETIRCPECGKIQQATVTHGFFNTYIHRCSCGYVIMESEWDEVKQTDKMKREHREDFSIVLTDETRKIVDAYIKRKREIRAKLLERKAKKA